jgi:hypothetical protein
MIEYSQRIAQETQTADLSDEEDNDEDNDEEKDGDDKALIRVLKKAATAHGNSQPTALTVETVDNLSRKLQTSSLNQSAPQPAPATVSQRTSPPCCTELTRAQQ